LNYPITVGACIARPRKKSAPHNRTTNGRPYGKKKTAPTEVSAVYIEIIPNGKLSLGVLAIPFDIVNIV